jgi:hypothetical protein
VIPEIPGVAIQPADAAVASDEGVTVVHSPPADVGGHETVVGRSYDTTEELTGVAVLPP